VKCGIWEQHKVHVLHDGPGQFVPERADKGCVVDWSGVGGGDFLEVEGKYEGEIREM
jgi:hypothetical protein